MRLAPLLLVLAALVAACDARAGDATIARDADALFGERLVPRLELVLAPEARASLERAPKEWVPATVRYGGRTYPEVGVRLKGNRSAQGFRGKPSFKLRFDKFVKGQRFAGQRELVLNNLVEDPTQVREALAYRLHRELGVAAPRTGWVQLVVDGERFGLYLDLEAIDKKLLARAYGDGKGTLYEGEFGCDLYPDDAPRFEQDGGDDVGHADLIALAGQVHAEPERLFADDGPLDVARVVAYLAVSAVIGDFDGYRHAHNYRLYRDPRGGRWSMLPWGLDRAFKKSLDVTDSGGLLARRCFADAGCRAAYRAALARAADRLEQLAGDGTLERWFTIVDAAGAGDARRPYGGGEMRRARAELRAFVARRPAEVRAALACLGGDAPARCAPPSPPPCEPVLAGGVRFEVCPMARTWTEAEAVCAARGGHLARLDDAPQAHELAAHLKGNQRWWIGLSDRAHEGALAWADGAPVGFTRFASGQPDDAACGEDCVAVRGKDGRWSDGHCEQRRPFVCRLP